MAYGGAAPGAPAMAGSTSASTIRQVKLDRESELRVEVANDSPLRLRLVNGTAEIFGTELPPENWLTFPPRLKFAVCFLEKEKKLILFILSIFSSQMGSSFLCKNFEFLNHLNRFLLGMELQLSWMALRKPTTSRTRYSLFLLFFLFDSGC